MCWAATPEPRTSTCTEVRPAPRGGTARGGRAAETPTSCHTARRLPTACRVHAARGRRSLAKGSHAARKGRSGRGVLPVGDSRRGCRAPCSGLHGAMLWPARHDAWTQGTISAWPVRLTSVCGRSRSVRCRRTVGRDSPASPRARRLRPSALCRVKPIDPSRTSIRPPVTSSVTSQLRFDQQGLRIRVTDCF